MHDRVILPNIRRLNNTATTTTTTLQSTSNSTHQPKDCNAIYCLKQSILLLEIKKNYNTMTEAMDVAAAVADAVAAATTSTVVNVDQSQQQQQLEPPQPLPQGWIMRESRSNPGYYYYFHMDTGIVSWDPPMVNIQPMDIDNNTTTATSGILQPSYII